MNFYSLKQFKYSLARPIRCIVLPQIIAGGDLIIIFFLTKGGGGDYLREGDYSREVIILKNAHWKSCPKYIVFYYTVIFRELL